MGGSFCLKEVMDMKLYMLARWLVIQARARVRAENVNSEALRPEFTEVWIAGWEALPTGEKQALLDEALKDLGY